MTFKTTWEQLGAMPGEKPLHGGHGDRAGALSLPLALVHVAGLAADESLVKLHLSADLHNATTLQREPDALKHEPSGFLSHTERACQFTRTDSVLGAGKQPNGRPPFSERDRGVLENGSDLHGELFPGRAVLALPQLAGADEIDSGGIATRATHYAVRPAKPHHESKSVIFVTEVLNRAVQGFREVIFSFHANSFAQLPTDASI